MSNQPLPSRGEQPVTAHSSLPIADFPQGDLTLEKDAEMLAALREALERGLSPSALNQFVGCSLQFYFARIAKFREAEEVEETLGADGFGTAVHAALEKLLQPFVEQQRPLTAADIPVLLKQADQEVARALRREEKERHARADEGLNHVLGQVAAQLVRRYLESLPTQPGVLPLQVHALEARLHATVFVPQPNGAEPLPVRLIGYADRLDQLPDGRLRVVDYKTGMVQGFELKLQKAREPANAAVERLLMEATSGAEKVRQLWLYRFMLEANDQPAADAAILSLRNIPAGLLTADMSFLTEDGQSFRQASEALLGQLVNRILDPWEPIRKTDDLDRCQYCAYRGICAR